MTHPIDPSLSPDSEHDADSPSVVRETYTRVNPQISMKLPEGKTRWKAFEASWTPQEIADEVGDWSRSRAAQFIQETSWMVLSLFGNLEDAASKALTSLSMRVFDAGLSRLDFEQAFQGSKLGAQSETFSGSLRLSPSTESSASSPTEPSVFRSAELSDAPASEPLPKTAPIWEDASACLSLWDQIRSALGDASGSRSAQDTALLLIALDLASAKNAETITAHLAGLHRDRSDGSSEDLGMDSFLDLRRLEVAHQLAPSSPRLM